MKFLSPLAFQSRWPKLCGIFAIFRMFPVDGLLTVSENNKRGVKDPKY
jgi:hypothetical protein